MNKKNVMAITVAIVIFGAVIGNFAVNMFSQTSEPAAEAPSLIGSSLPEYRLLSLDGVRENGNQWLGKVQIINFWATWCPPCKREIPVLIKLQNDYKDRGLQVIGIALDEAEAVANYVKEHGINYPTLAGDDEVVEVSEKLGNDLGILPYTVIADRAGKISFIRYGEVDRQTVENEIKKLL